MLAMGVFIGEMGSYGLITRLGNQFIRLVALESHQMEIEWF